MVLEGTGELAGQGPGSVAGSRGRANHNTDSMLPGSSAVLRGASACLCLCVPSNPHARPCMPRVHAPTMIPTHDPPFNRSR